MWITMRKRPEGWVRSLAGRHIESAATVRNIGDALTHEAATPASGSLAVLALWVEDLPGECDLNHMAVTVDGIPARLESIGAPRNVTAQRLNVWLPAGVRTGIVPVEVKWVGQALFPTVWARIIPPGDSVPRLANVTDGANVLIAWRTTSGLLKVKLLEVSDPDVFRATLDHRDVEATESFCADPLNRCFEFNFRVPSGTASGPHVLRVALGKREFQPVTIEVA